MAEIIYSKNGEMKCTAKSVRYTGSFMGVPQLEVEIDGPVPLGFEVGDYIVFSYDGIRYSIIDLPQVQKQSSSGSVGNAFVYENVVFKSPLGLLSSIDFLDTVLSDNNIHYSTLPVFSFFGDIKDFADRLQANLNRIYSSGWKVTVEGYDDSSNANYDILHDYKEISLSNQNCLDALSIPYETWKITYVFMLDSNGNNCIVFNHALDAASAKSYGKGNGLYSLTKRMSAEKPIITRLRAYGGTDNLPARYYNKQSGISESVCLPNLMIPRSKWKNQNDPVSAYIDSTDVDSEDTSMSRYGIREKSVYFDGSGEYDEIIPTIKGMTAKMIRDAKANMGDSSNIPSSSRYPNSTRMDKVVVAESISDDGMESDGETYTSYSEMTLPSDKSGSIVFTKNGEFSIIFDISTEFLISAPGTYRFNPLENEDGIVTPIVTISGISSQNQITSANTIFNVFVVTESGKKELCASLPLLLHYTQSQALLYISGIDNTKDSFYVRIPYKGTLLFQINISGGIQIVIDNAICQSQSVSLNVYQGPLILQERFWVRIKQIGFDINSYPSSEEAKLVMNSGGCAGRSFNIMKNSTKFEADTETWKFECFRSYDESLSQKFPNSTYPISPDDEFVLTGLNMPDLYVEMASQKVYDEAVKLLRESKDGLEVFDLDIDNKVAYLDSAKIKEGMILPLFDEDLGVGSIIKGSEGEEDTIVYEYRIIDSMTIEIGSSPLPSIRAVLRENKEESVFKSLTRRIQNITYRAKGNVGKTQVFSITEEVVRANSQQASSSMSPDNSSGFVTLYTDQIITGEKTFANDVIFGGEVSEGVFGSMLVPSTEGPGKYSLYVSTDPVSGEAPTAPSGIDEDELWDILGGSGTEVIDISHIPSIPTSKITGLDTVLAPYATQAWVQQQGYLASVSLATISDLDSGWDALLKAAPSYYSKAEIGSLLSSYYTKTEADGRFVGVSNEQTVSGKKTFSSLLTASSGISSTNADFSGYVSAGVLYLPYSGGNRMYSLYVSTGPVSGEQPSEGIGLDEEAMWTALGGSTSSKVISASHLPSLSSLSGNLDSSRITGLDSALSSYATKSWVTSQNYAVQANDNNLISHGNEFNFIPAGFSNAVWFNYRAKGGTCNISQYVFGRGSAVAGGYADLLAKNFIAEGGGSFIKRMQTDASNFEEGPMWDNTAGTSHLAAIGYWNVTQKVFINPCYNEVTDVWDDAVGKYNFVVGKNFLTYNTYPILHSGNYTSYTVTKTGGGASGTWGINISGNAATADVSNYLFLNPNNGTHASENDAVPANGRFAIYDVNTATTAGGNDGYIMAFRWPSGNFATQVFLDADNTGIMALRHMNNSNVWTDWYRILHSGNIGSYNAGSATKLQTSRTLWGRPFDGTGNVSGDIVANYFYLNDSSSNPYLCFSVGGVNAYLQMTSAGISMDYGRASGKIIHLASSGNVGIGTTSPAYELDVAGNLRATDIVASGRLFVPSSEGNDKYYIRIE